MRHLVILVCAVCATLALPVPEMDQKQQIAQIAQLIPQETLEKLILIDPNGQLSDRNKRTIGVLRELFPNLSQLLDQKIQQISSQLFRVVGRFLLRGGLGGGGGDAANGTARANPGRKVSVALPTYPPDLEGDDDDEDEDEDQDEVKASVVVQADSVAGFSEQVAKTVDGTTPAAGTEAGPTRLNLNGSPSVEAVQSFEQENSVGDAQGESSDVSLARVDAPQDQQEAASANSPAVDDLTLDDDQSDENRNKRFLPFGVGGSVSAGAGAGGSSGGGSGNFLFDIIRLVAGSGNTEQGDENAAAQPADSLSFSKTVSGGYEEAIPGPVTRLFVIANRGIANLIQDLILRIAATSERIVNFKARLITSII